MGLMVKLVVIVVGYTNVTMYARGQVPTLSIIVFLTGDFRGDLDTGETGFILQR